MKKTFYTLKGIKPLCFIFCLLFIATALLSGCASNSDIICSECNSKISADSKFCSVCGTSISSKVENDFNGMNSAAENDISFVIEILTSTKTEVEAAYNTTRGAYDLTMSGSFLGLDGEFSICYLDEEIYQVIFKRNIENYDSDAIVNGISQVLGKYDLYDEEWNEYEWYTDTLELYFYVDERIYFNLPSERNSEQSTTHVGGSI